MTALKNTYLALLMATVTNLRHWLQKQVQPAYKPQNDILFIETDSHICTEEGHGEP